MVALPRPSLIHPEPETLLRLPELRLRVPVGDYGVCKGFALTFSDLPNGSRIQPKDLPDAAIIRKRAALWQPWCSVASWYLWRACDLPGS